MQTEERREHESLSEVLDQALTRLRAGDSVEGCLADYPRHAIALAPLLSTSTELRDQATAPLPPEMEDWLSTSALDFTILAQQMTTKANGRSQPAAPKRFGVLAPRQAQPGLATALDEALARMKAGASVEECLASYPQHAPALQPLLHTSEELYTQAGAPLPAGLEAWLPAGAREFATIADQLAPRYARRRKPVRMPSAAWQRAIAAVVVTAVLMGAADTASAQSLPGEALYTWKRAKEDLALTLETDPRERSQLHVNYAHRRLDEFHSLVEEGKKPDPTLVAETLDSLIIHIQEAIKEDIVNPEVAALVDQAEEALENADTVGPEAQPVVEQAQETVHGIGQQLPALGATSSAGAPNPSSASTFETAVDGGSSADPIDVPTSTLSPSPVPSEGSTAEIGTPIGVPTNPVPSSPSGPPTLPSRTPTPVIAETATPTIEFTNSPTPDPDTAVPSTPEPPTDVPPPPPSVTNTPLPPTSIATNTPLPPSDTPYPTLTPAPATEVVSPELPSPTRQAPTVPPDRPTRTPTNTPTPTPTNTPTNTPTDTPTNTPTDTPTNTQTDTPTNTPTDTPTNTPTDTPTNTPTDTPTETLVATPSATSTETATGTAFALQNNDTAVATPPPIPTPTDVVPHNDPAAPVETSQQSSVPSDSRRRARRA